MTTCSLTDLAIFRNLLVCLVVACAVSGCTTTRTVYVDTPASGADLVDEQPAPPPPRTEVIYESPSPDFVWVPGIWIWNGHAYVWRSGYWAYPPHPHAHWYGGHWARFHGRYVYHEGGWR